MELALEESKLKGTDKIVAMMIVFLTEDDIKEWKDLLKNGKIKAKEGYGDNSR
jgi:hypothetical protein